MLRGLFIGFLFFISSCIDFKMSESEALDEFVDKSIVPMFGEVQFDGRSISYAYTDQKRDTLVAFVHGSPGSWSAFIDYFKNDTLLKKMDLVSIDRVGFGNSDFGEPELSIEHQSAQMTAVLDEFSHSTKIVVGHSLGGPVVARMGMDNPNKFERLVLVAPSIDPELEVDQELRKWLNTVLVRWLMPTDFRVSNDEIMPLKGELEKMIPLWSAISTNVVVIQGTADNLVPKENADFAKRMLPDSLLDVRMLEGADHFIPWTHPNEILKALY